MGYHIIKIGGMEAADPSVRESIWSQINSLGTNTRIVLVHGGGPQSTAVASMLDHKPVKIDGRRITGSLDLRIAQWVIRGELNAGLVASASSFGIQAIGLCGADGSLLKANRRPPVEIEGGTIDFGYVGDIAEVDVDVLDRLADAGLTPVIACLSVDDSGQLLNTNADSVAAAVAQAVRAESLSLVTEVGSVLKDSLPLQEISEAGYQTGVADGWIEGGMVVKLEMGFETLRKGVQSVRVVPPRDVMGQSSGTRLVL